MAFTLPALEPHQEVAKDFIVTHPHCGIFLGIGGMKTLTTLAALFEARPTGHILVIAPLSIARSTWLDEIAKWDIPLRTKSLIVDEEDRPLSQAARLQRFGEVFTDPPTMYFINRELLTQPSQATNKLEATSAQTHPGPLAARLATTLSGTGPLTAEELTERIREEDLASGAKPTAKSKITSAITESVTAGTIERRRHDCSSCRGKSCSKCSFGLIDQMPRTKVNGKDVIKWPFATVIIDESQGFKDYRSNRFKALSKVRPAVTRLIELTGTPTPQSLLDIWAQMYLLDQGRTLGRFTTFRAKYFTPTVHVDGRPVKWAILPGAEDEIYRDIAPYVMSARNVSIKLPPVTHVPVNVTLPKDIKNGYDKFARQLVLELISPDPNDPRRHIITAENQAILHGKLVQYASGTIYLNDSREYAVIHREKLEMVDHLIANSASNVLLAYRFISEKHELVKHLTKRGHHVEAFDGSRDMVRRWNAQQIPVMVVHPASAGPGLNLQDGGSTLIWHTLPDSAEHYLQLNGRLARPGQQNPVQIYEITTKATRDAKLPGSLAIKIKVQQGLLDAVELNVYDISLDIDELLGDLDIDPL